MAGHSINIALLTEAPRVAISFGQAEVSGQRICVGCLF